MSQKPQTQSRLMERLRAQLLDAKATTSSEDKPEKPGSLRSPNHIALGPARIFVVVLLAASLIALLVWWVLKIGSGSPRPPGDLPSNTLGFVTVTLDSNGKETSRRTLQAEYFAEDIGGGVSIEMVKIPSGEFLMGSPPKEAERDTDVGPQHKVNVSEFYMGRFEVTREQWRQVARMPRVNIDLKEDPAGFTDSWRLPVEQISWAEAAEFCDRLRKESGKAFHLPTEAEWEYAARAGTTTPFAFGPTITLGIVNYNGAYPHHAAENGVARNKTVEVGSLGFANAFGLYDMHGNVWEWCQDVYHNGYAGNPPSDGSAWMTGGEQDKRVMRGGSWNYIGRRCRSANRSWCVAGNRFNEVGFRVVCTAD